MPERTLRFQHKLWQIINSCQSGAAFWSESGDSIIFRFSQFKREYLDRNINFCKSNKIASFVRQLNLYGFRKLVKTGSSKKRLQDHHEFQNPFFKRGRKDLLQNVVRSSTAPTAWKSSSQLNESKFKRSSRRGKKGRGRRKIKHQQPELDDADHCCGILENNKFSEGNSDKWSSPKYFSWGISNFERCSVESEILVLPKVEQSKSKQCNSVQSVTQDERIKSKENVDNCMIQKTLSPPTENEDSGFVYKFQNFEANHTLRTQPGEVFPYLDDDFLLVSDKDDGEDDDGFYNALLENEETSSYLNEAILFGEKEISESTLGNASVKFCSCNDCEISEEYLELVSANARMRNTERPLFHCVCNSGIPPKWMLTAFPA